MTKKPQETNVSMWKEYREALERLNKDYKTLLKTNAMAVHNLKYLRGILDD